MGKPSKPLQGNADKDERQNAAEKQQGKAKNKLVPAPSPLHSPLFTLPDELPVRTKSRHIELGNNLAELMREVGLNPNTGRGKRGDAQRLKDQMVRLFASSISFQYSKKAEGIVGQRSLGMLIAPRRELWWDPRELTQGNLWRSWIELGEDFFNAVTGAAVPVDNRALRVLNNSPLALDLYGWATYKVRFRFIPKGSLNSSRIKISGASSAPIIQILRTSKRSS